MTSLNHSVFLLWPVGVAQISFQNVVASSGSGDSFMELLSPLSSLYSLDWFVLNSLFWWYCSWFLVWCLILIQALDILTLSCCIRYRWALASSWHFLFMHSFPDMLNLRFLLFTSSSLLTSFLHSLILFPYLLFHYWYLLILLLLLFSDFCFTTNLSAILSNSLFQCFQSRCLSISILSQIHFTFLIDNNNNDNENNDSKMITVVPAIMIITKVLAMIIVIKLMIEVMFYTFKLFLKLAFYNYD